MTMNYEKNATAKQIKKFFGVPLSVFCLLFLRIFSMAHGLSIRDRLSLLFVFFLSRTICAASNSDNSFSSMLIVHTAGINLTTQTLKDNFKLHKKLSFAFVDSNIPLIQLFLLTYLLKSGWSNLGIMFEKSFVFNNVSSNWSIMARATRKIAFTPEKVERKPITCLFRNSISCFLNIYVKAISLQKKWFNSRVNDGYVPSNRRRSHTASTVSQHGKDVNKHKNHGVIYNNGCAPSFSGKLQIMHQWNKTIFCYKTFSDWCIKELMRTLTRCECNRGNLLPNRSSNTAPCLCILN